MSVLNKRWLASQWTLLLILFVVNWDSLAKANPPNIILIVADDLGYGDLGCYGSTVNQTPAIDRLAKEGVRFTDFHSSGAMCTPTRAATLTGQYQQRFGPDFDQAISGVAHHDSGLPHEAITIAEVLKTKGYQTACFGKWHLGYVPPWLPPNQGFDLFRGLGSGDGDHHSHIDRWGREDWWHNNKLEMDTGYTAELLTDYSIDFIKEHRKQPFFLYLPHLAIHFPWQGPNDPPHRKEGQSYGQDKWGIIPEPYNVQPHIQAMIQSLDESVRRILATLDRLQLNKQTLVIFTSDNGGYITYGKNFRNISSNGPLRGQKATLYEGGHRVPMIVRWTGQISPGTSMALTHSTDLFPTLATIAGGVNPSFVLDGIDLSSHLYNKTALPGRTLFWRQKNSKAVRKNNWKLIQNGNSIELYDLQKDLSEQENLASQKPLLVKEMTQAWEEWNTEMNQYAERYQNEK
ncbi:Twin-arginine translocation pathway signal [Planctomycetales bacterium 10988]|nr:Twin-arginine translocation pathway signal [Planctomycetales bacterium 10988]